jgi:signal transduction histidine kinase
VPGLTTHISPVETHRRFTPKAEVALAASVAAEGDQRFVLTFSVRDTGIGIPEEVKEKLFRPFAQGDTSVALLLASLAALD